jgi:hypothetical protein
MPQELLLHALDPAAAPAASAAVPPIWGRGEPGCHPADGGAKPEVLQGMGPKLRRAVHALLAADLGRLGVVADGVTLDFSGARADGREHDAHDGRMVSLAGVRAVGPDGELRHAGDVDFLRDELAEELVCWWVDGPPGHIPDAVWERLDFGVRRRIGGDAHFRGDPKVQAAWQKPESRR